MPSSPQLKIVVYQSFAEAASLRPKWNALAKDNFMLQWEWLSNAWDHCQSQSNAQRQQLLIVTLIAPNNEIVGIAPLYRRRGLAGRVLRFVGDAMICTDYVRVLAQNDWNYAVNERLAEWIASPDFKRMHGSIDWIEIEGHTLSDVGWVIFWNTLVRQQWSRQSFSIEGTWLTQLPLQTDSPALSTLLKTNIGPTIDNQYYKLFYDNLSKSRKRKVKKSFKLLNDGIVEFQVLTTKEAIETEWPTFVDLHQRRRVSLGQPGCFFDPNFENFLRSASLAFAEANQIVLAKLIHQNSAIGYLLIFTAANKLAMYQSGLHPDFEHLEPGHLINSLALQYAIERGYKSYDFLRGDEPYKSGWNAERIQLQRTRCTSPRLSSQLFNNLWNAGRALRGWGTHHTTSAVNQSTD